MIRGIIFTTTFFILSFLLAPSFEVQSTGPLVYLAEVEGEIKVGTYQYLKRVIREAEEAGVEYLIVKLDTPGGLLGATRDIVDLLLASPVKTVVFVHKEGGWAYSAGTFILLAADYAIVHPIASIGAAEPRIGIAETDPKLVEGMASWMRSLAEGKQRNSEVAEKFVRENLTLTGREAEELGVIEGTARDLEELFLTLNILEPEVKKISPTPLERFFNILSNPFLISLFFALGPLGLIFAFRTGEFELSGILGLLFLLIALWGLGVIQFSTLGILLTLGGIFLLILEVSQPGFGIFGALGIVFFLFGIFTFEAEPLFSPRIFDAMTLVVLGAALCLAVFFVIVGRGVAKSLREKPKTGPEALIGKTGEVIKELSPFGQVKVDQEIWSAKSLNEEIIPKDSKVEVIKIEGNTLLVQPVRER